MNKWFEETFLPSIFQKVGTDSGKWLTQKQTAICIDNMNENTALRDNAYGGYYKSLYYTIKWSGRDVTLGYSKLNGCGFITFGLTAKEQMESNIAYEAKKEEERRVRIERVKGYPERLEKKITKLRKEIAAWKEELNFDIKDGEIEDAKFDQKKIEELEAKLKTYTT